MISMQEKKEAIQIFQLIWSECATAAEVFEKM